MLQEINRDVLEFLLLYVVHKYCKDGVIEFSSEELANAAVEEYLYKLITSNGGTFTLDVKTKAELDKEENEA